MATLDFGKGISQDICSKGLKQQMHKHDHLERGQSSTFSLPLLISCHSPGLLLKQIPLGSTQTRASPWVFLTNLEGNTDSNVVNLKACDLRAVGSYFVLQVENVAWTTGFHEAAEQM